ncbi:MAG: TIGR04283 family arsenosugar biosynthesis glycosyltransferase [Chlorobiaceae bacterium]
MEPRTISIIIPTYNEENIIGQTLQTILTFTEHAEEIEIIVSDASSDRTPDILSTFPVKVCKSTKGRAIQMNTGAHQAKGEILYFLHADSIPPPTFLEDIHSAVETGKKAGCFRMGFDDNNPIMKLFGWFTQFPLIFCRGGDQSLFIDRTLFWEIGGYNDTMLIMEDFDIIKRIEQRELFHILETEVTTSARKYHKNGIIQLQTIFASIHLMYALGFDQESLVKYYRESIT